MIKKKLLAVSCICLCFSLTACKKQTETMNPDVATPTVEATQNNDQKEAESTATPEATQEPTAEPTAEPTKEAATAPKVATIVEAEFADTLKSEDGSVELVKASYKYPQIDNAANDPNIDKINQAIKDFTKKKYDEVYENGKSYATDMYPQITKQDEINATFPFAVEAAYEVTFNDNNLVSVHVSTYTDFHGAHPSTEDFAYTYDTLTGEQLPISYFYGDSDADAKEYVAQSFHTVFNEEPDLFYENAGDILSSGEFEYGWYLTEEGIQIFVNPYILAPYVAGNQEMTFAYDTNVTMFHHLDRVMK